MTKKTQLKDMSRKDREPLAHLENRDLMPLPAPLDSPEKDKPWKLLTDKVRENVESGLDDTVAINIPQPKTKEEEDELVQKFLSGLDKLFTEEKQLDLPPASRPEHGSTAPSARPVRRRATFLRPAGATSSTAPTSARRSCAASTSST